MSKKGVNEVLAENLAYFMRDRGLSQTALSSKSGVAQTTISLYLNPGNRQPGKTGKIPSGKLSEVEALAEADLIDAQIAGGFPEPIAIVMRLTWAGNDFVDAVKDDALWKRAMSKVVKSGASFTFEILKEALKTEITQGFPSLRSGA